MEAKRVKLDLSNIFNDYRRRAIILIRPEWKNIESIQSHIINLFGLEHYIYLTNVEEILFPAAEHTNVIEHNEELVVHKITLNDLMAPNPVTNGVGHNNEESEIVTNVKKKNNHYSQSAQPTPNGKISKMVEIQSSSEEETELQIKAFQKLDQIQNLREVPPSALNDVPAKRRRKRVRKRKNAGDDPKPSTSQHKDTPRPTHLWSSNPKNVHVRFSDASSSISSSDEDGKNPKKRCKFINDDVPARKIQISRVHYWNSQTQSYQMTQHTENERNEPMIEPERTRVSNLRLEIVPRTSIGPVRPDSSQTETAVDDLPEAEVPLVTPVQTPTTTLPTGPTTDTLETLRKEISQLNLPAVECDKLKLSDTIAFKLLRMDDQCQPTISDYIIGCIEKVNAERKEFAIRLLAGKSEIGSRICMTVITEDNKIGIMEEDHIDVKFEELYEPRYCLFPM